MWIEPNHYVELLLLFYSHNPTQPIINSHKSLLLLFIFISIEIIIAGVGTLVGIINVVVGESNPKCIYIYIQHKYIEKRKYILHNYCDFSCHNNCAIFTQKIAYHTDYALFSWIIFSI